LSRSFSSKNPCCFITIDYIIFLYVFKEFPEVPLKEIIEAHQLWLNNSGEARASLIDADLHGANLDFSVLPL
jgi:hypothetical protein